MDELVFAIWLGAILELVLLICFFVLCSNVAKIKKMVSPSGNPPTPYTMYAMYLAAGDKEKAKSVLMEIILADPNVQETINRSSDILKNVLARYDKAMKEVGLEIDPQKAFESKSLF